MEELNANIVSGWIYADKEAVRDGLVLAFAGTECVGAGRVEIFRQDLFDAGLGDGFLGYSFPIKLHGSLDVGSVYVRLDSDEALFIHKDSVLIGRDRHAGLVVAQSQLAQATVWQAKLTQWLFDNGRLEQTEFDFLRAVRQLGAYVRTLREGKPFTKADRTRIPPAEAAEKAMTLLHMSDVRLIEVRIASLSDLTLGNIGLPSGQAEPIVALWSEQRVRLGVVEGSQTDGSGLGALPECPDGAIDMTFGGDQLVFLDLRCSFGPKSAAPIGGITVFVAGMSGLVDGGTVDGDAGGASSVG
jgi:hypothetical protein